MTTTTHTTAIYTTKPNPNTIHRHPSGSITTTVT